VVIEQQTRTWRCQFDVSRAWRVDPTVADEIVESPLRGARGSRYYVIFGTGYTEENAWDPVMVER
jgi:hypothetical protein